MADAVLRATVSALAVEFRLHAFSFGQSRPDLSFQSRHALAAATQGVKMVQLLGDGASLLLLSFLIDRGDAIVQTFAAVPRHLL